MSRPLRSVAVRLPPRAAAWQAPRGAESVGVCGYCLFVLMTGLRVRITILTSGIIRSRPPQSTCEARCRRNAGWKLAECQQHPGEGLSPEWQCRWLFGAQIRKQLADCGGTTKRLGIPEEVSPRVALSPDTFAEGGVRGKERDAPRLRSVDALRR
eukprot:gene17797-biopygen1315